MKRSWITFDRFAAFSLAVLLFCVSATKLAAQQIVENDPDLSRIDIVEHLGAQLPLDLAFTDEHGAQVMLGSYFDGHRPVLITLGYYQCPMLCNLVLNGLTKTTKTIDFSPGVEYRIVSVSINPNETPELAKAKKQSYVVDFGRQGIDTGWAFLTGKEENIKKLADAIGFNYFYDTARGEYAHAGAVYAISPTGTITRYLYGIEFPVNDVRLSLLEASEGKIGSTLDKLLLYCYHYDPASKGYAVQAASVMKLGGLVTILIVGIWIGILARGNRARVAAVSTNASVDQKQESHRG